MTVGGSTAIVGGSTAIVDVAPRPQRKKLSRGSRTVWRWLPLVLGIVVVRTLLPAPAFAASPNVPTGTTSTAATEASTACAKGAIFEAAGRYDDAAKAYSDAIAIDPTPSSCGATKLAQLMRTHFPIGDPCTVATALHRAGADDTARAVLTSALQAQQDTKCASSLLHELNRQSVLDRAKADASNFWWWAVAAAVALVLVLLVFPPARRGLQALLRRRFKTQLVLRDFGDYGGTPPAAATLSALIAARFAPTVRDSPIDQIDAAADLGDALDAIAKVSPQLGQVTAILQALESILGVPRRFTVSGQVHCSPTGGPGITLKLADQDTTRKATTIWHGPLGHGGEATIDDFSELVVPAVAWLRYEIAALLAPADTASSTENSLSSALVEGGIADERRGRLYRAIDWYRRALAADPTNIRARVALALAFSRSNRDFDLVEEILESTLFMLEANLATRA